MNTQKLQEALEDLQGKKALIEQAIAALSRTIAMMEAESDNRRLPLVASSSPDGSYINDVMTVLGESAKPLHISEIVKRISAIRGEEIDRPAIESSLSRHITKTKNPKIVRTKPGYYGLAGWEESSVADDRAGLYAQR